MADPIEIIAAAGPCAVPLSWPPASTASDADLPVRLNAIAMDSGGTESIAKLEIKRHAADVLTLFVTEPGAAAVEFRMDLTEYEHIVGLGEQFVELGQRGHAVEGSIVDILLAEPRSSYYHAPLAYSSRGHALLVDTYATYTADIGVTDPGQLRLRVPGDTVKAYLILGSPRAIIGRVTELTGRPMVPPAWTFGVWSCMHSGTESVLREAKRLRELAIPCSAAWVDDPYDEETNFGVGSGGTYPKGEYPDLRLLNQELHGLGFKTLGYLNCMLFRDTSMWRDGVEKGYAVRRPDGSAAHIGFWHPQHQSVGVLAFEADCATLVDYTNADAVDWWGRNIERLLKQVGWDGWMQDFGEQVTADMVFDDGTTGADNHNRYVVQYHAATARVRVVAKPDSVFFVRAGYLGAQRYAPMVWGGDQGCDWSPERGLPSVISAGLSVGLTGVSTWGPDISGIEELSDDTENGGADKELWLRWLQLGALSPVMRVHLGFKEKAGTPVDMWTDGETTTAFARYARLHMRLFPYLWSLSNEAAETGVPIMRSLLIEYPDDPTCWTLSHQFLLGDSLLVAPVVERGARTRRTYLPAGVWEDLWTGERHAGGGWVEVDAPLERIPLLQRAGSVIPLLPEDAIPQTIAEQKFAQGDFDIEWRVCDGDPSERTLFDGTSVRVNGQSAEIHGPRERTYTMSTRNAIVGGGRGTHVVITW